MFEGKIKEWFMHWISNRLLRNVVFWVMIGYMEVFNIDLLSSEGMDWGQRIRLFFMHFSIFAPLCYFNNLYLLPKFFEKGKYLKYFSLTIISVLIYTPYSGYMIDYYTDFVPSDLPRLELEQLNYWIGVLANTIFVGVFSLSKLGSDHIIDKTRVEKIEKENVVSELDSLKNQINPHFLFNGLNTLYGLSINDDVRTSDAIMKLSEIMRYVLYDCNTEKVDIEKEIVYINNYIEFGKLRRRSLEDITFNIQGNIEGKKVVPLLLIPFIENAFKHGVDTHTENPYLHVGINIHQNHMVFICENSLKGGKSEVRKDSGIGLANVKRRLELLYPQKHSLEMQNGQTRYRVELKLDLS